ncbi:hypothetical protein [Indiicoccus explosivorum]|uniref:hypothetical protein n=1 Tax=Indiicoccus explosivorum TaxID=1917864 RepID=UPI000B42E0E0|nr:hypothetical protein [Indiicoccus explosivorum]
MIDRLKEHVPNKDGMTLDKYLAERHTRGKWETAGEDILFIEETSGMPVKYKWTVTGSKVEAANGHAAAVAPDLHTRKRTVEEEREKLPPEARELYDFIQEQFGMHGDMSLTLKEAAYKFQVTPEQAREIYLETDERLYR